MSSKRKKRKKFLQQLTTCCSQCNKQKSRNEFSTNQLRKPVKNRKCKKCVIKNEEKIRQQLQQFKNKVKAQMDENISQQYKKKQYMKIENTDSNTLTELEKLHNHCYGNTVFSEIRLILTMSCLFIDSSIKREIQKALKQWPEAFICYDRVIIASDCLENPQSQYTIYKQICLKYSTFIDMNSSKPCYLKLGYSNGEISRDGITLYDTEITLKTDNVQYLFNNSGDFNEEKDASVPVPRKTTNSKSKKTESKKNALNATENKTNNESKKTDQSHNNPNKKKKRKRKKKNASKAITQKESNPNKF